MTHHQYVDRLNLLYRYYFGRCSSELAQLVQLPFSWGRSTCYSDRLHDFSFTIPICYQDVYVKSFFPHTARLWNSLPIECFPVAYDLSGFKSNRQTSFNCRFFLSLFPICFSCFPYPICVLLFLVTACLIVDVQLCMEWIPIKKRPTFTSELLLSVTDSLLLQSNITIKQ